jgi:O-antigen ligase
MTKHREHKTTPLTERIAYVLLLAIPVVATVAYGAVDPFALGAAAVLVAVMFVMRAASALRGGSFAYDNSKLQLPLIGLILLGAFQLLPLAAPLSPELLTNAGRNSLSLDPYATRWWLIKAVTVLVYFSSALVLIDSKRRAKQVVFGIIIFGAAAAFFGIVQELVNPGAIYGLRPTPQAISFGPFVNRHHFAAFMEMTIALALSVLLGGAVLPNRRAFLVFALALMCIAAMMTGSRGGILSIFGVVAFILAVKFIIHKREGKRQEISVRKLLVAPAAIVLVLGIFGSAMFLGSGDLVARGFGAGNADDISNGRFHFWAVSLKIAEANPIIGVGFDAFGVAFPKYDTWPGRFRLEQAHNDYLQMLTDGGIIGLALVLIFIFLFAKIALRNISNSTDAVHRAFAIGAFAGCLGIMIHSFFDFPLRTNSNIFFFALLAAVAILPGEMFERRKKHRHEHRISEPSPE